MHVCECVCMIVCVSVGERERSMLSHAENFNDSFLWNSLSRDYLFN